MEGWLPATGVEYGWDEAPRLVRPEKSYENHPAPLHPAFRGYAEYMLTDEFSIAVDHLLQSSVDVLTVVMCSESVWWRCHRRLVSDSLALVRGTEVRHLIHDGTLREHRLTEGVRAAGDHIVYDQLPAALER
jgi:uncharacterized protein (DUF488 family)